MRKRYIQHPVTLELIPAEEYVRPDPSGYYIIPDIPDYTSPIDGKLISGRKQRREDLLRSNCRPYEGRDQELKEANRSQSYLDQDVDRKTHEVVARSFYQLHPDKRRILSRT